MPRPPAADPRSHKSASSAEMPRHRAIYEELLKEIQGGTYQPGDRLPSEAALCERFDASRITVAKAIQTLQQDRLVMRRPGSGTYVERPEHVASMQFGLLIPDLGTTEIFEPICQGLMRAPVAKAHSLTWGHTDPGVHDPEVVADQLCQQYIAQKVAGVFFAPMEFTETSDRANRRIAATLERAGIPVVLLDRCVERYPDRSNFDLVGIDNQRAGHLLTRHMLQAGAKRILFAARRFSASTVEQRIAGYREALLAADRGATCTVVTGDFEDAAFVQTMLKSERPDAIICANDATAARLMHTLLGLGVRIPEEIRMAGIDDVRYARFLPVPLTTIRQDCLEMGTVAMGIMMDRLNRPDHPVRDVLVKSELIVRSSSGMPQSVE